MAQSFRVIAGVIAGMAAAVLIAYLAAERPFSFRLVDRECENAQQQYFDARDRSIIDKKQNPTAQNDAAADERNHADLCAQKRMADAAEAGFWLLLVSLVAAIGAAIAGWRTVSIMRETAQRELRAYINLASAHLVLGNPSPSGRDVILDVVFENFGSTPAHRVRLIPTLAIAGARVAQFVQNYGSVGPTSKFRVRQTFNLTPEQIAILELEGVLFAFGAHVTYRTVFVAESAEPSETVVNLVNGHVFRKDGGVGPTAGFHMVAAGDNRST